jgi:hypothetical protein
MQHLNCDVALSGDRNHVVRKSDITVAEVEILRALHGQDSVRNIQPTRTTTSDGGALLDRLRRKYRRRMPALPGEKSRCIVDTVFPGPRPKLPVSLADIGEHRLEQKTHQEDRAESDDESDPLATPPAAKTTRSRRSA